MSDHRKDLERLLVEAREAGELAALSSVLDAAARESAALVAPKPGADDVPERFGLVGDSDGMCRVFGLIERLAPSDVPVLVRGETGTGKELIARALHDESPRSERPFVAENCAAVPANLIESELFGHKKGAFTDAVRDRDGHFVVADGGTMFLDEIGDMPLEMQAKLLRVLESGEVRPVGGDRTVQVDVRVVAATNRDLAAMVEERTFRQDLYFRLNVVEIELPPLRDRNGDIAHLTRYFLRDAARSLEPAALRALEAYRWPGNVRQLENEIKRAVALTRGTILLSDLSVEVQNENA